MAYTPIVVGATANDGTGESLRSGGVKINAMFSELYGRPQGIEPAPTDGQTYGRQFALWTPVLALTGGNANIPGTVQAGSVSSLGAVSGTNLNASGTVTGGALQSTGSISAAGTVTAGAANINGNVSATGQVGASSIVSTGNINASATITANHLYAYGNMEAAGVITAGDHVDTRFLAGGEGGAGALRCVNSADTVTFRWGTNGSVISLHYRVDGTEEQVMPRGANVAGFTIIGGVPSPTTVALVVSANSLVDYQIYCDVSDARIKSNVAPTSVDALAALLAVQVSQFDVNADALAAVDPGDAASRERTRAAGDQHVGIGLVAQQVQATIPEMVTVQQQPEGHDPALPDDMHFLVHSAAVPYLIRAIQQLEARVLELEAAAP